MSKLYIVLVNGYVFNTANLHNKVNANVWTYPLITGLLSQLTQPDNIFCINTNEEVSASIILKDLNTNGNVSFTNSYFDSKHDFHTDAIRIEKLRIDKSSIDSEHPGSLIRSISEHLGQGSN